jgi:proteic killer suppression protein
MILSFKDRETEALYESGKSRIYGAISRTAIRKLIQLDEAIQLSDLAAPPGNRLEALKANRLGQHSIRINDQWRICFRWSGTDAGDVEICVYH